MLCNVIFVVSVIFISIIAYLLSLIFPSLFSFTSIHPSLRFQSNIFMTMITSFIPEYSNWGGSKYLKIPQIFEFGMRLCHPDLEILFDSEFVVSPTVKNRHQIFAFLWNIFDGSRLIYYFSIYYSNSLFWNNRGNMILLWR